MWLGSFLFAIWDRCPGGLSFEGLSPWKGTGICGWSQPDGSRAVLTCTGYGSGMQNIYLFFFFLFLPHHWKHLEHAGRNSNELPPISKPSLLLSSYPAASELLPEPVPLCSTKAAGWDLVWKAPCERHLRSNWLGEWNISSGWEERVLWQRIRSGCQVEPLNRGQPERKNHFFLSLAWFLAFRFAKILHLLPGNNFDEKNTREAVLDRWCCKKRVAARCHGRKWRSGCETRTGRKGGWVTQARAGLGGMM